MIKNRPIHFCISTMTVIAFVALSCSKTNTLVVVEKTLNLANKQDVISRLRFGGNIKIACEGTSLTYGEDIGGTDTVTSYLLHAPTQAIYQYPTTMIKDLNNPSITLSLRGYPGDRTTEGISRWKDSTTADICIIEYGTNDAYNFAAYSSGKVPLAAYKAQLRILVERRVNQGAWVIVCLPPLLQSHDGTLNAYRTAAKQVAKDFYATVFDVEESIKNVPAPYSDAVHLNARAYQKWGNDMAGLIQRMEGD